MAGITAFRMEKSSPAQATAGTAQAIVLGRAGKAGTLTSAIGVPVGAVATDETDFRLWTIQNRGQDGTGTTIMATLTTKTTGGAAMVAYDERSYTLSATPANLIVAAGDIIAVLETVGASGKAHTGLLTKATFDPVYGTS